MIQRILATAMASIMLASCGGGGGSSSVTPSNPGSTAPQIVKFTFKVPTRNKQVVRKKLIAGKYVSPATLGLGLTYSTTASTFTASQLSTPNVALDLSTCSTTAFSSCATNADGSETFTIQVPIPPGNYTYEFVTWDSSPTGSPLSFTGSQLSTALAALVVTAGGAPQSPNFVLNGVPASVVLASAPSQAHVVQTASGYTIIGNAGQTFFLNALDQDGFIITGGGAPTLALSDSTGSFSAVQNATSPNMWTVTAQPAALNNASTSFSYSATAPAGSGIATQQGTTSIGIEPELWLSNNGLYGRAMTFTFGATPSASIGTQVDYVTLGSSSTIAADPSGNLFVNEGGNVHLFSAPTNFMPPADTGSVVNTGVGSSPGGMVIDSNDQLYVPDASGPSGVGAILVYNNAPPNGTLGSVLYGVTSGTGYSLGSGSVVNCCSPTIHAPQSVAIAPSTAAIPSSLQGTIWVTTSAGVEVFKDTGATLQDLGQAFSDALNPTAIAVGSDGTVWTFDAKSGTLGAHAISATFPLSAEGTPFTVGSSALQMAADSIGEVWLSTSAGYIYPYTMSGCPSTCAIVQGTSSIYTGVGYSGMYLAP